MPRVVPDQKFKFESDELFRKLSRDSEVLHSKTLLSMFPFDLDQVKNFLHLL